MTNHQDYTGFYYFMGLALNVREMDGQLVAAMPDVPEGYEILLESFDPDQFWMDGGPLNDETVAFVRDEANEVRAMRTGGFELVKVSPETIKDLPITERLLAPVLNLTITKEWAFSELLQSLLKKADGDWVDYRLPYPKYEFVQYVSEHYMLIFHGSNNQIGGHDDGELIRLQTIGKEIRAVARRATLQDDRFLVALPADMRPQLEDYITLQRTFMPAAHFAIIPSTDEIRLEISALPPAFAQVLRKEYADLLAD